MPPALTTEFRKLGTVRSPWLLLALGPLIVVAGISGLVASGGNVHDPALPGRAFSHVGLAAIFTLVFGILAVAGEYSRGTITDTFLSFPARRSVIIAKLAAYGAVGAAAGLVSAGVALAVTAAWWSAKGGTFHLRRRAPGAPSAGAWPPTPRSPRSASAWAPWSAAWPPPWPPPWPGSRWWRGSRAS